jgi:hypothetical protein
MKPRSLAEVGVGLIAVYLIALHVAGWLGQGLLMLHSALRYWREGSLVAVVFGVLLPTAAPLVFALVLLRNRRGLASRLAPAETEGPSPPGRTEDGVSAGPESMIYRVGFALTGVLLAGEAVPKLSRSVWNLGVYLQRRDPERLPDEFSRHVLERSWQGLLAFALQAGFGVALVLAAPTLARRCASRAGGARAGGPSQAV